MIIFQTLVFLIVSVLCGLAVMDVKHLSLAFILIIVFWGLALGYFLIGIVLPMFSGFIAPLSAIAIGVIGILSGIFLHKN